MKFMLVVPDGVGIRNFLCGSLIDHLLAAGEVVVWHGLPDAAIAAQRERWGARVRWQPLPSAREGLIERTLRQAKIYAQLSWQANNGGRAVLKQLRWPQRPIDRAVTALARALGQRCASARGTLRLDRLHAHAARRARSFSISLGLLGAEEPAALFCTHQRASLAVAPLLAARHLGIPTATFIYSWDNLPKGRMAVQPDYFLVWSSFMKDELRSYHPEVSSDRVHVVGTPQFEPYFNPALLRPREQFLRDAGLDPARPVVCFSGDDASTSPYDPAYLADLAAALRSIPPSERPQILFRRCPVDLSDRYEPVLEQYPEIGVSEPLWRAWAGDWTQVIPTVEDVALLANVVHHCDAVVNVGSTMAMDFAILDKPGIYLAYNQPAQGPDWDIHDLYQLPHFRSLHALQPVYWARSAQDLAGCVLRALHRPQEKSRERQRWLNERVAHPLSQASARCAQALRQIALCGVTEALPAAELRSF